MNKEAIIMQTAIDYDMSYDEVESIYNMYHDEDVIEFYNQLEEFITNRANKID